MPEIKHTFIGGKMNKDLDERIVPNGEYRDASNIQVRTTDGDAAGTVQGIKGNTSIGSFTNTVNPETGFTTKTIGSVVDEKNDNIYFFMVAPKVGNISKANVTTTTIFIDSIIEQNTNGTTSPVIIDEHTIIAPASTVFGAASPFSTLGDNWSEIVIEDATIIEKVKAGMKVELFNNPTDGSDPINLLENAVISNVYYWEGQADSPYGENEWHIQFHIPQPQITTSVGELWVKFSNPKVLNFDYDSKITAINIIDNLLFWTDGSSEPKKINIDRCKAGTPLSIPSEEEYITNGNFETSIGNGNGVNAPGSWYSTGNLTMNYDEVEGASVSPSVNNYENFPEQGLFALSINNIGHWNINAYNGGEFVHTISGLTIGNTYVLSIDNEITSGTLLASLNQTPSPQTQLELNSDNTGIVSATFVAGLETVTLHLYAQYQGNVASGYLHNISITDDTSEAGYSHTKLYVEDPTDVSSEAYIPITDLEHYNFESDVIDDNLKEEHITVIRKAPTRPLSLVLNSTDRGEGNSSVVISDSSFITVDGSSSTGSLEINDTRIFTHDNLASTIFRVNDLLDFTADYVEINDVDQSITFETEVKIVCKFISYMDENKQPVNESTKSIKVEVVTIGEYLDWSMTDWSVSLRQKKPLFELKLGRFAYRYRYEDGEYSSFSPWSELAFLPGIFDYERKTGYNLGMRNNVREIIIKDFLPFKTKPLDVKSVDILYKPTNTANCYVVKTINRGVDAEWDLFTPNAIDNTQKLTGQLNITSEMIHSVLSEDQILRTWDNVPRYAQSQEITGNRLLFGNYIQGYDIQLPVGLSQEVIGNNIDGIGVPNKSVKSIRDYKWGMVFGDKYGRETPVFASGYTTGYDDNYTSLTGDVTINKNYSNTANFFKITQNWENPINTNNAPPSWAEYVKYYVKEPSNEYYNLVLNAWYWADEDGDTVWLSFQSVDRQKVDEETYLILKSKNGESKSVTEEARYKIIAIESNAPDFIKTFKNDLGKLQIIPGDESESGNTSSSIWSGGVAALSDAATGTVTGSQPDLFVTPGENGKMFSIDQSSWDGLFGVTGHDAIGPKYSTKISFRIIGEDINGVEKYSRWNKVTNWRYKNAVGIESGDIDPEAFDIFYDEVFGEDADMLSRFLADESLGYSGTVTGLRYFLEFKEEEVENKPEFDGRFFVKVQADTALKNNTLMIAEVKESFIPLGNHNVDYIESESKNSAVTGQYAETEWAWGQGDGWFHDAFAGVEDEYDIDQGPSNWEYDYGTTATNGGELMFSRLSAKYGQASSTDNEGNIMTSDGSTSYFAPNQDAPPVLKIVPCPAEDVGNSNGVAGVTINPNTSGSTDIGGLGTGFGYFAWDSRTTSFWSNRKNNYGSRPFIDKARVAGTRPSGSNNPPYNPADVGFFIGEDSDRPTGLDAGEISATLSENLGMVDANGTSYESAPTTPDNGTLGRMYVAITGWDNFLDIPNSGDRMFMDKMGTLGTYFRFTADPDNVYKIIKTDEYIDAINGHFPQEYGYINSNWYIMLSQGGGVNARLGHRVNFRRVDNTTGKLINEGIDVNTFDPRGIVRHDGTMSMGIELLRQASVGGGQIVFDSNNSVFETEPREDMDLDIYYEGSGSIPLTLNEKNIHDFIPSNCGISIERVNEGSVEKIELPNIQSTDIIKSPTHMINNIAAKPRIFNDNFDETTGEYGIGDPIVHITGIDVNGNTVDQDHGIYVGDHVVFHHKNRTRTRSKITGFFNKTEIENSGEVVAASYAPVPTPLIGFIQANPSGDWPHYVTDGTSAWDPAGGNFVDTLTMFQNQMLEGAVGDIVSGMQMVGYIEVDPSEWLDEAETQANPDFNQPIAGGVEGIAPPGIVVTGTSDNNVQIMVTSPTETPFYFQDSSGNSQTHEEFVDANQMGKKFRVEWIYPPTGYYSIDKEVWQYPIDLSWYNCYSYGNGVESDRIRDDFNAPRIDNGVRVSTTFSGYGKENKSSGLIYSGLYNSTSEINNLNEFNMAQKITKDLNPTYGSIQRLKTRDTDLIVFTEDKVLKVLSSKDALFNADGNPQLTATERVLGQAMPFIGDYGISNNPESLAWDQYRLYFTDKQRGAVLRLSRDGLTPISNVGMKTWFRDNLKLADKALGTFDVVSGEYNLTLTKTSGDPDYDTTISFSEESKGWVSFKTFLPEGGGSVSGSYITAKGNNIWQHYTNDSYNSFYGIDPTTNSNYESSISVLFNDSPDIIKSFNSVNYEGSQSKVIQNTIDTNEFYNLENKKGWYINSFETDKQSGTVPEFIEKEGKWFNKISGVATTLTNLDTGEFTTQGIGNPSSVSGVYM